LYRIFLTNLMKIGADEKYSIAQIDSLNWRETRCGFAELFLEPYVELYFRHPAYSEHPVVNVSFQGAQLFCEWLTGYYNSMPGRKYKKVRFRLPTDTEWEHAAKGGLEYVLYPWGNRLIYNNQYACNYYHVGDENIIRNISTGTLIVNERKADASPGKLNDFNSLTVPVTYYQPNEFGLYNVCGNVAEMVIDKPVARGGGWLSPGGDVTIFSSAVCTQSAIDTGFRYFMEVVEY